MSSERILDRIDPMVLEAVEKYRLGLELRWQTGVQLMPNANGTMEFHVWLYLETPSPLVGMTLSNLLRLPTQVTDQAVLDGELETALTNLRELRAKQLADPLGEMQPLVDARSAAAPPPVVQAPQGLIVP